jgi:nucleoid DNA-binding protein
MNQEQLISQSASNNALQKNTVARCFDAIIDTIESALSEGESVTIRRFGTFKVTEHKQRNGVNPRNQEPIIIPANKQVKFNAGSELLGIVRGEI